MIKRIVSAYYSSHYPFHGFEKLLSASMTTALAPEDLKKQDLLVVWGGQDISPTLYGHPVNKRTHAYVELSERDKVEWGLMQEAVRQQIPIIGICRGAQMLCALAGGSLWQHVTGHGGDHVVRTDDGREFVTNSLHHQMMNTDNTLHVVKAWSKHQRSEIYFDGEDGHRIFDYQEPEAVLFPTVKGLAVQWHPEMMPYNCPATMYVEELLNGLL